MKFEEIDNTVRQKEEARAAMYFPACFQRRWYHGRMPKKHALFLSVLCLVLLAGGALFAYPMLHDTYQRDMTLVHTGTLDLQAALALLQTLPHDPFNVQDIQNAQQHFTHAFQNLTQVTGDLAFVPDLLNTVSVSGYLLGTTKHLLRLSLEIAQAGSISCTLLLMLASRLRDPFQQTRGLMSVDVTRLQQGLQALRMHIDQISAQVVQLQGADLGSDPQHIAAILRRYAAYLPVFQQGIQQAVAFCSVAFSVLGTATPAHYLIELLDTSELRPGGGFIGNYAIATIAGARLQSVSVRDSYLLDKNKPLATPFPPDYAWFNLSRNWSFYYSNLDADFPTSARNGELLYQRTGDKQVLQGVFAVTPACIAQVLALIGPISVPGYQEVVSAQNLMQRIHYHQLIEEGGGGDIPAADGNSSVRKHFTTLLSSSFLTKLRSLPSSVLFKLLPIVFTALQSKDLQIYFNSPAAEDVLHVYHVDDSIQTHAADNILVVDANLASSKANTYIASTLQDLVTLDEQGTAAHTTQIMLAWTKRGLTIHDFYGSIHYLCYIRIYLPANSVLRTAPAWQSVDSGLSLGRRFWGGYVSMFYPSAGVLRFNWSVAGAAQADVHGWHYQYQIQRQAGAQQEIKVNITLPTCGSIIESSIGSRFDARKALNLVETLKKDTAISMSYSCTHPG